MVFAGSQQKADDVIARDVAILAPCSGATRLSSLRTVSPWAVPAKAHSSADHLVQPVKFIDSLFSAASAAQPDATAPDVLAALEGGLSMSAEQARELSNLEEKLRGTKSTSKRAKLERQREKLLEAVRELQEEQEGEEEEEDGGGEDDADTAVVAGRVAGATRSSMPRLRISRGEGAVYGGAVVGRSLRVGGWLAALREGGMGGERTKTTPAGSRREKTWQREVLAEQLRCALLEGLMARLATTTPGEAPDAGATASPAEVRELDQRCGGCTRRAASLDAHVHPSGGHDACD